MTIEYSVTRLAALKSRFPNAWTLERMASGRDGPSMARALGDTVFRPEIMSLSTHKERSATIPTVLRLVNDGGLRLRRIFATRAMEAWPECFDLFVARWELEEIKAALRYLVFRGTQLEKRFYFFSYFPAPARFHLWSAHMKPAEFQSRLTRAGHPFSPCVNADRFMRDSVATEFFMERFFFKDYAQKRWPLLGQACRDFYKNQLDVINIKNAWLLRDANVKRKERPDLFIDAGGDIKLNDFIAIASLEKNREALALIQRKLGIRLDPEKLDSPYGLSTALKNALVVTYRREYIRNPVGAWAFFLFAEELDAMIADVKNAIYCGATCSTVDVVSRRFIGAKAS